MEDAVVGKLEIMDSIRNEFVKLKKGGKLLLSVSCRHVLKTNVLLLEFLINEKNLNGLYICVDIPHNHVERLLKTYKISSKDLTYIDAITGLSTLEREYQENIYYIDNPFNVKIINSAIKSIQSDGVKRFVILDNMATLQFYSTEIEKFFNKFIGSIDDFNISYLMLAVDKDKHKDTYDIIRPFCDSELEIKHDWINGLKEI